MSMLTTIRDIHSFYFRFGDRGKLLLFALILLATGCKEKYVSPAPAVATGYLVLEGVFNNGGGASNIKLSRTTNLNDNPNIREKGALVKLTASNNASWMLAESSDGNYTINNLHLDTSLSYRLAIITSNGEEYLSDPVAVKNNPAIDNISWERDKEGVQLYINTHDPQNKTRNYQWEFAETWEFHSVFYSNLKYLFGPAPDYPKVGATPRSANDKQIFTCWQYNSSNTIMIGSSAKLSQDIIHLPITHIPNASWKLSVLYSILVKQTAWSNEGYQFLERMKKNTETVGSVFDAQPSELNTNIRCTTNPAKPVIGFFNICTIRENRFFLKNSDVPGWGYRTSCDQEEVEILDPEFGKKTNGKLPLDVSVYGNFGSIVSIFIAPSSCVDCTERGSNVKPVFWP